MIWPLLAFIGAVGAAYWFRKHESSVIDAIAANHAAQAHAAAAATSAHPAESVQHAQASQAAAAIATTRTADAAKAAVTERQKQITSQLALWTLATQDAAVAISAMVAAQAEMDPRNRHAWSKSLGELQRDINDAQAALDDASARQADASAQLARLGQGH